MNPIEELADLHATLSAHTNCATDGRNWRRLWQRLCEQRQDAIRSAFDDGLTKGEALARIPTTVSAVEREEWRQEREKLQDALERTERNVAIIEANAVAINRNANRCIKELEEDKCGLAADALNARQVIHEFMAYVKCGQVPEDAHCVRRARQLLASDLLGARDHAGGEKEKYNGEFSRGGAHHE